MLPLHYCQILHLYSLIDSGLRQENGLFTVIYHLDYSDLFFRSKKLWQVTFTLQSKSLEHFKDRFQSTSY